MGTWTPLEPVMDEIRKNFPLYTDKQRDDLVYEIAYHVVKAREDNLPSLDKWVELMIELTPDAERV